MFDVHFTYQVTVNTTNPNNTRRLFRQEPTFRLQ